MVAPLQAIMPISKTSSSKTSYHGYISAFSFDLDETVNPDWMVRIPDATSLGSLSIPGTHDTLTFDLVDNEGYQCQNHNLETQLRAGLRYLDVRSRLVYRKHGNANDPPLIGIYHGYAYTGYTFEDVLQTVFEFLKAHPTEGIIMRIKEEGRPVPTNGDKPEDEDLDEALAAAVAEKNDNDDSSMASKYNVTFEEAFNYYRETNPRTAPGATEHFLYPWPQPSTPSRVLPTMGELRGRVLILYEFKTVNGDEARYGIPWTSPEHIALEDLWIIADPAHLDDKWEAVQENLAAAAASPVGADVLFLSHLSASVGVLPIEAAAGPVGDRNNGSLIVGINDRTGAWLDEGGAGGAKIGVVSK